MRGIMMLARQREAARFWSDPSLNGIELMHARYTAHQLAPHSHETFAIGVVLSGALSFSYRSPPEVIPAGHIMLIHPGEVHTGRCVGDRGCSYRMLYAQPEALSAVFPKRNKAAIDFPVFQNQNVVDPRLAERMVRLHWSLERLGTSLLEKETRLMGVLSMLVGRHASPRPRETPSKGNKEFVRKVLECIEDR